MHLAGMQQESPGRKPWDEWHGNGISPQKRSKSEAIRTLHRHESRCVRCCAFSSAGCSALQGWRPGLSCAAPSIVQYGAYHNDVGDGDILHHHRLRNFDILRRHNCVSYGTRHCLNRRGDFRYFLRARARCAIISPFNAETLRGVVVQLVRTPACHAGGREFESRRPRHPIKIPCFHACRWDRNRDMLSCLLSGRGGVPPQDQVCSEGRPSNSTFA